MKPDAESEAEYELVKRHVQELGEHFESVRIFVTVHGDAGQGETRSIESGCGNFYAQIGQVQEWLDIQRARSRAFLEKEDDEDGPESLA